MQNVFRSSTFAAFYEIITSQNKNYPDKLILFLKQATSGIYVAILLFEDLPISLIICGLITNILYYFILQTFPFIELASPTFIASVGMFWWSYLLTVPFTVTVI